jgi:hypothetical protein
MKMAWKWSGWDAVGIAQHTLWPDTPQMRPSLRMKYFLTKKIDAQRGRKAESVEERLNENCSYYCVSCHDVSPSTLLSSLAKTKVKGVQERKQS